MPQKKIVVGIINSNAEIIEVLSLAFQMEGFKTVSAHLQTFKTDPTKYIQFIRRHKPKVLIIDVPPPYEENWGFAQKLQAIEVTGTIGFVYTTTNKEKLEQLVGDTQTIEIVGKPFDLLEVVQAATQTYQVTHISNKLKVPNDLNYEKQSSLQLEEHPPFEEAK